jgi:EF-P beta-lysylation protein EpmB
MAHQQQPELAGWKKELARAFRRPEELLRYLDCDAPELLEARPATADFPMLVPRGFAALMRRADPRDPLLLQVLPSAAESLPVAGYCKDPVDDRAACRAPGLLRKYAGRALIIVSGACAVHCRYCFRRHFSYTRQLLAHPNTDQGEERIHAALAAIAATPNVHEVILSGGDPLLLDDDALSRLVKHIEQLEQVRRLRLHTRLPVVLPSRITPALCTLLSSSRLRPVLVIHANHAAELGAAAATALDKLAQARIPLLNQSVLLRNVNDNAEVLAALAERLFDLGVINYYLHQLDRVDGAAHFEVADEQARQLLASLHARLPGYLVPRLVREIPGAPGKTPLA